MTFLEFARMAVAAGLAARMCCDTHWQLTGGRFTVNYYPTTSRAYLNGYAKAVHAEPIDAIRYAESGVRPDRKAKRKTTYRGIKRRRLRSDARCYWCKCAIDESSATIDHLVPLSRGGSNASDNLVLACKPCNQRRGASLPQRKARGD